MLVAALLATATADLAVHVKTYSDSARSAWLLARTPVSPVNAPAMTISPTVLLHRFHPIWLRVGARRGRTIGARCCCRVLGCVSVGSFKGVSANDCQSVGNELIH